MSESERLQRPRIGIVAIAKDESRFICEWIAHHLAMGFHHIHVYDNGSEDGTRELLTSVSRHFPVSWEAWPNPLGLSPQISAYNDFLKKNTADFDWIAFFDIDEFVVARDGRWSIEDILSSYSSEVGAVGVNWVTFGTSGLKTRSYDLVRDAFKYGPPREFGNNKHIKTILRPDYASAMKIHHCELSRGVYIHADGTPLHMNRKAGLSDTISHGVLQLNHYQVKSLEDFWIKINRGRVCKREGDPHKFRSDPLEFLAKIDRMDEYYDEILCNDGRFRSILDSVYRACK